MDQLVSKDKALSEGRAQLAASVSTLLKEVNDNYVKQSEVNNKEILYERYEKLSLRVSSLLYQIKFFTGTGRSMDRNQFL
ncbi:MAG: hypothetical protein NTY96_13140 [Bacteroidetes bacterium]|nr:hypothetical protein [Bacteroidota bacterium]